VQRAGGGRGIHTVWRTPLRMCLPDCRASCSPSQAIDATLKAWAHVFTPKYAEARIAAAHKLTVRMRALRQRAEELGAELEAANAALQDAKAAAAAAAAAAAEQQQRLQARMLPPSQPRRAFPHARAEALFDCKALCGPHATRRGVPRGARCQLRLLAACSVAAGGTREGAAQ